MATLIKLTKTNGTTQGGYRWDVGTTHRLPAKDNPQLCSAGSGPGQAAYINQPKLGLMRMGR